MPEFLVSSDDSGVSIDQSRAGWERVSFHVRKAEAGSATEFSSEGEELAIIPLSGALTVTAAGDTWTFGNRANVFERAGEALYLPRGSVYTVSCEGPVEYAVCGAICEADHEPRMVTAADYSIETRGAGNATRSVATLLPPDFPADRLLVVEVWTPAGNWSSYPPHKHDEANEPGEVPLEETYYYRLADDQRGFAMQRVYSPSRGVDESFIVQDGDVAIIPWGYHTTAAAPGYDLYYLNVLAGDARILAAAEDPDHSWTKQEWPQLPIDPRAAQLPSNRD